MPRAYEPQLTRGFKLPFNNQPVALGERADDRPLPAADVLAAGERLAGAGDHSQSAGAAASVASKRGRCRATTGTNLSRKAAS